MNKTFLVLAGLMMGTSAYAQQKYSQHDFKLVAQAAVLATLCGMDEERKKIDEIAGRFAYYDEALTRIEVEWGEMWNAEQNAGGPGAQRREEICAELAPVMVPATVNGLKINPPIK